MTKKLVPTEQVVTAVRFTHKHGHDVGIYDSPEAAHEAIFDWVREWIDNDYYGDKEELEGLVEAGDVSAVIDAWNENTDEWIGIEDTRVYTLASVED